MMCECAKRIFSLLFWSLLSEPVKCSDRRKTMVMAAMTIGQEFQNVFKAYFFEKKSELWELH